MLLVCTLLSLPAYVLFWSGKAMNTNDMDSQMSFNEFIGSLSLGNLGASTQVLEVPLDADVESRLIC